MRTSAVGLIRLSGPNTYHESTTLTVIANSEAVARGLPNTVTIDQAEALVANGDAIWLHRLGDPKREHQAEGRTS